MTDRRKDRILRLPEVIHRSGLSVATIGRKEKAGLFPARTRMSANTVGWYESEIDAWVANPMGWQAAA